MTSTAVATLADGGDIYTKPTNVKVKKVAHTQQPSVGFYS